MPHLQINQKADTHMKRTLQLTITALALMLLTIPVLAADVCPEQGKVESVVDGDLNDIILEAGTEVCIKGSTTLVNVTADGTSTLYQLLGNGHDVSHYTVLGSTTTTLPVETTTTVTESTTTTVAETTSTAPSTTSTTVTGSMEELPTVIIPAVTITAPSTTEAAVLPFTGPDDMGPWMLLGLALAALGAVLVWTYRGDER